MTEGHTVLFDLSNLAYFGAYLCGRGVEEHPHAAIAIQQSTLQLMRTIYRRIRPDWAFFACDHQHYWRRKIFPDYKAQRQLTLLKQQVRAAIALIKKEKQSLCLEVESCEADDIIYTVTRLVEGPVTIVSSDSDFVQLASERVQLFHPKAQNFVTPPKNPQYELFLKCIRGDTADNIPSAYPYVQQKRLQAAFRNKGFYQQLMQSVNKHGKRVEECYQFNRQLIDLSRIPKEIQSRLQKEIQVKMQAVLAQ